LSYGRLGASRLAILPLAAAGVQAWQGDPNC